MSTLKNNTKGNVIRIMSYMFKYMPLLSWELYVTKLATYQISQDVSYNLLHALIKLALQNKITNWCINLKYHHFISRKTC